MCWSLFVLANQINMFRFIKGKVDTDTNITKVLGLNMEHILDLPSKGKIRNTVALWGFYNRLIPSRNHYFPKVCKEIIFITDGQCCVLIDRISYTEKWFDTITPLAERYMMFPVQVDFIEVIHPRFSGKFLVSLNTQIDQAQRIQYAYCFRYPWTEDRIFIPEDGLIIFVSILVISLTHILSVTLFFNHQDLIFCICIHVFEARSLRPKSVNNLQDSPMRRCIWPLAILYVSYYQASNIM